MSALRLWSGCEALFTPRPLGPLYDVAGALGAEVDALLAGDRNRERLFPAVLAAAGATPTLLVVEDVHWADHATLDLLKYLVRRVGRVPLLLLVTYRDDEVAPDHPLITLLGETTRARRLSLPRLSPLGATANPRPSRASSPARRRSERNGSRSRSMKRG